MLNLNDMAKPAESLMDDVKDYIAKREDMFKLKTAKAASTAIGRLLTMFLVVLVIFIVLTLLAFALVLLLGELIGSYAGAAFIMMGVFVLLLIWLIAKRKTLFVNPFVRMFIGLFYDEE